MLLKFIVLTVLLSLAFSAPTDNAECSQNASAAYVDVDIVIDTSSNMGITNLRKIVTSLSLILPKFPIGNQIDISQNQRNTRISITTFDDYATIVANYTQINSISDLTNVLNTITIRNTTESNLYDALNKVMYIHTNCSDVLDDGCSEIYYYMRPSATIIFAASANSESIDRIPELVNTIDFFDDGTPISVNFNQGNTDVNYLLNLITFNLFANTSMYNYSGSSNTLNRDLEWAILQANCYCRDDWGTSTFQFNKTLNQWQKNAECMILFLLADDLPTTLLGLCDFNQDLKQIPGFILTADREQWLETEETWISPTERYAKDLANIPSNYVPFYFGLHNGTQGVWSWWNYGANATDAIEFGASYFNWAPGYPKAGDGCAVVDADASGQHLVWKSYECSAASTGLSMALCQAPACDSTNLICCTDCSYCQLNPGCEIFPKKKAIKKGSKKNRLLRKMGRRNGRIVRID